ncbi:ABC transporter ATP-binding protein [Streptomyces globosus]|uniref:ABC transporter ATP-binding protein n=1 Tax=Streptomyces globosus TaxID=68209 RepID=A0A344U3B2_9ACTN|nr:MULTISPECIES: ATP-binding cassette domain-containing protein [Streptomyces]AXE25383.1 ABC transporter ATP-binding protein [Streptomyces globosus]
MNTIHIRALTKEYGAKTAVDKLTFDVLPGRVTGFLGPNGAGKSTTLRLLLGLDRATSGTATVGGHRYTDLEQPLLRVGALLDAHAAHGSRTARSHLRALAAANRIPARRVEEVLEQTGIAAAAGRRIKTYSLGMRQRLGIAAALLGDPGVILLDEPANGLDPEGIIWIRELMRGLAAEGRTVLVSSHLMSETAAFADHLVILGRGRLLADTPTAAFIEERSTPRVRLRTSEPGRLRAALAEAGLEPVEGAGHWTVEGARAERIGALAAREGVPVLELADEQVSLEQAYLDLTADHAEFTSNP